MLTDGDALNSSLQKMKLKNRDERIVGYEEKVVGGGGTLTEFQTVMIFSNLLALWFQQPLIQFLSFLICEIICD